MLHRKRHYIILGHVYLANRGRDDEFEVICKVDFYVTPREARTSTYPGAEPQIEDIGAKVLPPHDATLTTAQMIQIEDAVIADLEDDQAPLWDHVAYSDACALDNAADARREAAE